MTDTVLTITQAPGATPFPTNKEEWGTLMMRVFDKALAEGKYSPAIQCLGIIRKHLESLGQDMPEHLVAMEAALKATKAATTTSRRSKNRESTTMIPDAPHPDETVEAWKQRLMAIYDGSMVDKQFGVALRTQVVFGCHMGYLGRNAKVVTVMTPEEEAAAAKQEARDALAARVDRLIASQGFDPNPVDEDGGYYDDDTDEYVYKSAAAEKKAEATWNETVSDFMNHGIFPGTPKAEIKAIKARKDQQATQEAAKIRMASQYASRPPIPAKPVALNAGTPYETGDFSITRGPLTGLYKNWTTIPRAPGSYNETWVLKDPPVDNQRPTARSETGDRYEYYDEQPDGKGPGWVLVKPDEPVQSTNDPP